MTICSPLLRTEMSILSWKKLNEDGSWRPCRFTYCVAEVDVKSLLAVMMYWRLVFCISLATSLLPGLKQPLPTETFLIYGHSWRHQEYTLLCELTESCAVCTYCIDARALTATVMLQFSTNYVKTPCLSRLLAVLMSWRWKVNKRCNGHVAKVNICSINVSPTINCFE